MGVRFSVLIPVYNRERYIRQAIDSVLSQTFASFELIAVDDGSTDSSADILKSYGSRIKFLRQQNQGAEVARNTAAAAAQGEYLVLLDSDDFLFPFTLAVYDQVLRSFNSPPLIVGRELYYEDGKPIATETLAAGHIEAFQFPDYLSKTITLSNFNSKLVIRKSVFEEAGGCRNSTADTWFNDDLNLMLKTGVYGPFVAIRHPYTVAYRQHDSNTIKNVRAIAESLLLLARAERNGEYPGGRERRWDRYAVIGGRASTWAVKYCWLRGERMLALRLLLGTAPMVGMAAWRRAVRSLRPLTPAIVFPEEQVRTGAAVEVPQEFVSRTAKSRGARAGS